MDRYYADMAKKVIIDVDPGIDDAIALAIALFDPRLEVLAGNIRMRMVNDSGDSSYQCDQEGSNEGNTRTKRHGQKTSEDGCVVTPNAMRRQPLKLTHLL